MSPLVSVRCTPETRLEIGAVSERWGCTWWEAAARLLAEAASAQAGALEPVPEVRSVDF